MSKLREGRAWCVVPPAHNVLSSWVVDTEEEGWVRHVGYDRKRAEADGWRVVRVRIVPEEASDE